MSVFARVTLPLAGLNFVNQASRAVVATVGPLLALEFALSASELGVLSAVFFAAYGLVQLPVGMALDRFGPRAVQMVLALCAALGLGMCGLATDAFWLGAGRMVTGIGVSAGLMAMIKANSQWYPKDRVAMATGGGMFVGAIGGMAATLPVQWLLPYMGWRGAFVVMAAAAVAVGLCIAIVVPRQPPTAAAPWRGMAQELRQFGRVFVHPEFLRFAPVVALLSGFNFTFQGLWAGPWLRDVGGLDDEARATVLLVLAMGVMTGGFGAGYLSSILQRRGAHPMLVPAAATIGTALLQVLLATHALPHPVALAILWFAFACCCSAGTAGYTAISQRFPPELAGRVATAINASMLVLVFFMQSAIGWILDLWPRTATGGWAGAGYSWAFVLTLSIQAAAVLWMILAPHWVRRRHGTAQ